MSSQATLVTQTEYDDLLNAGWKAERYYGQERTLTRPRDCCDTFGNTVAYSLTAPFLLAVTTALAVPACAISCVAGMAEETSRGQTDLNERQYLQAQQGSRNAQDNTASCVEGVCAWNTSLYNYFRPCSTLDTTRVKIISS